MPHPLRAQHHFQLRLACVAEERFFQRALALLFTDRDDALAAGKALFIQFINFRPQRGIIQIGDIEVGRLPLFLADPFFLATPFCFLLAACNSLRRTDLFICLV
ncbi:MAG: hypothetical protein R2867_31390 [Caldilineaceae bacterium]